jgi:hypothetical protein
MAGPVLCPTKSRLYERRLETFKTGDGYRLAIHSNLKFAGTVLAAEMVSARVSHFKRVRSLDGVRSHGHGAALGVEAAHRLASDQSTSAIPEYLSPTTVCSRQSIPTGGRIPTQQLPKNRRIDPVLPTLCFPDQKRDRRSRLGNYPHRRQAHWHRA